MINYIKINNFNKTNDFLTTLLKIKPKEKNKIIKINKKKIRIFTINIIKLIINILPKKKVNIYEINNYLKKNFQNKFKIMKNYIKLTLLIPNYLNYKSQNFILNTKK